MFGLSFETQLPVVASDPNRSDIACFVGFVGRRQTAVPAHIARWLTDRGWGRPEHGRFPFDSLRDVPVPIDTWDIFDALFAWEQRDFNGAGQFGSTYLGTAVRSFFAHGGRKCYVVRVGDPWPVLETATVHHQQAPDRLDALIPGFASFDQASPVDQRSWRGIGHLLGLDDISFLCLPDLPDIVATPTAPIPPAPAPPSLPAQFVECATSTTTAPPTTTTRLYRAPRTTIAGYTTWADAVQKTAVFLATYQREVQLVAVIPLPQAGTPAETHLLEFLVDGGSGPLARSLDVLGIATAFVQLVYPWVRTSGSQQLPQQLEPPDAILAGLLAQNALAQGTYGSAANLAVAGVLTAEPALNRPQLYRAVTGGGPDRALIQRVSLLGETPTGWRLLSDVTTSLNEAYRPASINRLLNVIVRSARLLGETMVFAASNEALWRMVRESLTQLLTGLYQAGALRGQTPDAAFQVRCDRSTMTQNDIDNGRIIATIQFDAAATIEQITVVLAMDEGGQVSLMQP